ncbi:MAG TPA: hypothetical protein VFN61_01955 [Acidimicrobiales bacterium]|nr:hypothetical protein [Acidimicrobiales bacterium]
MRRALALGAICIGLAACGGGGTAPTAAKHQVTHELHISVDDTTGSLGGYDASDPFNGGGQPGVVVYSGSGQIVASDPTFGATSTPDTGVGAGMTYTATVEVPTEPFYKVSIPHLGSIVFTLHQLETDGWQAPITYGPVG